jgi:hypothetical protein
MPYPDVKTPAALASEPAEYRRAVEKIIVSHAINELYGAQVFDEVAVAFAPTPYWKWLTCRVAMEEYGHHVRFFRLGREIGVPERHMLPHTTQKRTLSIFDFPLRSWEEFCVIKLVADLAEIVQVEDLLRCSYVPLRSAAKATLPEEKFHAKFGERSVSELTAESKPPRRRWIGSSRRCLRSSARMRRRTTSCIAASESSRGRTARCAPITWLASQEPSAGSASHCRRHEMNEPPVLRLLGVHARRRRGGPAAEDLVRGARTYFT